MSASDPVIVYPEEDPLTVLRTMAKFVSERRGIAEIWSPALTAVGRGTQIGYVVLCRQPEEKPVPIYCAETRTIQHMMLADWLHARGYEASSCVWEQINPWSAPPSVRSISGDVRWKLVIREAKVPPLPPSPPSSPSPPLPWKVPIAQPADDDATDALRLALKEFRRLERAKTNA